MLVSLESVVSSFGRGGLCLDCVGCVGALSIRYDFIFGQWFRTETLQELGSETLLLLL